MIGSDRPVEAVDEAPVILRTGVPADPNNLPPSANTLYVAGLGLDRGGSQEGPGAAFYEVTVSGWGWAKDADEPVIYTARYLLTPWRHRSRAGVSVETLVQSTTIHLGGVQPKGGGDSERVLIVQLQPVSGERELVVDVKRVGRRCLAPMISLREA